MNPTLFFDVLLLGTLLLVSWRLLGASDLFQAVVLFISFGLFLAVAWIRLSAPDIALAEAAVGAGLAGVLFLGAYRGIEPEGTRGDEESFREPSSGPCRLDPISPCPGRVHLFPAFTCVGALTALLVLAVLDLPRSGNGMADIVALSMDRSGVEHPVTAVLLNFRLYDTWLELGVLLLAILGILSLRRCRDISGIDSPRAPGMVLRRLVGALTPVMILATAYLLWLGSHAPGGAFQAGVVLAALLVLLWLAGYRSVTALPPALWSFCLVGGFALMLLMGVITTLVPGVLPLEYPAMWAGVLIVVMESVATVSIGVVLASLIVLSLDGGDPA